MRFGLIERLPMVIKEIAIHNLPLERVWFWVEQKELKRRIF
jgi:hypothetical protein